MTYTRHEGRLKVAKKNPPRRGARRGFPSTPREKYGMVAYEKALLRDEGYNGAERAYQEAVREYDARRPTRRNPELLTARMNPMRRAASVGEPVFVGKWILEVDANGIGFATNKHSAVTFWTKDGEQIYGDGVHLAEFYGPPQSVRARLKRMMAVARRKKNPGRLKRKYGKCRISRRRRN